jgi:hypothetical protein
MSHQIRCDSCGAPMTPTADGRLHACDYCGAKIQAAIDGAQVAAGFKLDLANVEAFLNELSRSLHGGLGERTKLHVEGTRIMLFEINLEPDLFLVKRESHGVVAQHKKLVRGIALKTNTHPLDRWVQMLADALAAHANENARVAQVLATLRGS